MDPISVFLAAAAIYVANILKGAVVPYIAQKALPATIEKIRVRRETFGLDSPELLRERIQNDTVKSGQYVEGSAFFSLYTDSHQPAVSLDMFKDTMFGLLAGLKQMDLSKPDPRILLNLVRFVLPTTQFPIIHDGIRVGFLYPHSMPGFFVPLVNFDGSVKSLPYLGGQIVLVKANDVPAIENRIVKYRTRVLTIPASELKAAYPGITDNAIDSALREGMLYVLSACEDNTFIEYLENSPHDNIIGSHFIETHWEQEDVIRYPKFGEVLNDSIVSVCNDLDIPKPMLRVELVKNINCWSLPGFHITQPIGYPYFHFQMITDLNYTDEAKEKERVFEAVSKGLLEHVNEAFNLETKGKDLNFIDNYETENHTILQSTAARSIQDPVLKVVRQWLEKENLMDDKEA